jgi:hypothetical protein
MVKKNQKKSKKSLFSCFFVGFALKYIKSVYINSVDNERGQQQRQARQKKDTKMENKNNMPHATFTVDRKRHTVTAATFEKVAESVMQTLAEMGKRIDCVAQNTIAGVYREYFWQGENEKRIVVTYHP